MPAYDVSDLGALLHGGGHTTVPSGSTPVARFLHVVDHGIDWGAPEGERSTVDAFSAVTAAEVIAQAPDALWRYVAYIQAYVALWAEEPYQLVMDGGTDDPVDRMAEVLDALRQAHEEAGLSTPWTSADLRAWIAQMKDEVDAVLEGDELEEDDPDSIAAAFDRLYVSLAALPVRG